MYQQPKKPAVILDLDETSITNFKSLKKYEFNDCDEVWHKILAQTEVEPILPTVEFYQYLRQINIDVFFISARWCEYRIQTQKALTYAGFSDYKGLTLLPPKFSSHQYTNFKTTSRRKIVQQGYTLLMNIGDKQSDLSNSEAPLNIKLPNYLY